MKELEKRSSDMPIQTRQLIQHFAKSQSGPNPVFATMGKIGEIVAMPSLYEIRDIVKKAGKNTLREIEKATIEKLSNKILR